MTAVAALDLTGITAAAENRGGHVMGVDRRLDRLEDAELVARLREAGERRCFEALYQRHRRRVLAVLLGLLRDPAAAEDLCHDAFLRAFEKLDSLRGEFEPWVVRIASNLALNLLRQRANRRRLEGELWPLPPSPPPEDEVAAHLEGRRALEILRHLGEEQRTTLTLRYLDGLSWAEIAERTGMSEAEVRSHLQNGRRNFRLAWVRPATAMGGAQ